MKSSKSETFINKAKAKHGNTYDYSKVSYINNVTEVLIICNKHGEFLQKPAVHLKGRGCKKCGYEKLVALSAASKLTLTTFLTRAKQAHGDKYDYSKVDYKDYHQPVTVICPEHGEFFPTPANHISNATGCPKCAMKARNAGLTKSFDSFVVAARIVHGDKYTYSETDQYTSTGRTAAIVICPIHGDFFVARREHLNGRGCPKCAKVSSANKIRIPFAEIQQRSDNRHGPIYEYDESSYTDTKGSIRVKCNSHGWFDQTVNSLLQGGGCRQCYSSGFQRSVGEFIESLGYAVDYNNRKMINCELDLVIEDKKLAVECDGLYWHSFNSPETKSEKYRHHYKHSLASDSSIQLISIREDEWAFKQPLVKSMLRHRLGLSQNRIYARDCEIITISNIEARAFINNNHIGGFRAANFNYGLAHSNKLVALMSFSTHPKYQYEVMRYCTERDLCVVGGASRLFAAFRKCFNPKSVLSYADRRYSQGKLYKQLGFKFLGITGPNYSYVKGFKVYSRQVFQKHKLAKKLQVFDPTISESANMFINRYRRIWDAGHYKFVWNK